MSQLEILTVLLEDMPREPAKRLKRSLGPRPAWHRFWEKVDRLSDCWIWTASTYANGYGQFTVLGEPIKAHRWAYENLVGPVPVGMQLDHLCHTRDVACTGGNDCKHRRCVNPAHLEPVTARVNSLRGNGRSGVNARKTHCIRNHPFDHANTRITPKGYRVCRRCHAIKTAQSRADKGRRPMSARPPT